jgi:hypothetical protein
MMGRFRSAACERGWHHECWWDLCTCGCHHDDDDDDLTPEEQSKMEADEREVGGDAPEYEDPRIAAAEWEQSWR